MRKRLMLCAGFLVLLAGCRLGNQTAENSGAESPATAHPGWQSEWDQVVAAAQHEGKVVVSGPTREAWRMVLTENFERQYPAIKVEYVGANSRDFWPRIFRERELGQYGWDLRVGGPDPEVYDAKERGVLDPARPLLLLPEAVDGSKWLGGLDSIFFDKGKKYVIGFISFVSFMVYVNRDLIPESDLSSVPQLNQPRWKGKIVIQDPRGGAGLNSLEVMLHVYGEPMLRDLLKKQELVVSNDVRQEAEWVIRGRYPIGIGLVPDAFLPFQEQGLKFNVKPMRESGQSLSTGTGGVQVINRALHPNAVKLYVNWLLTKDVQSRLSVATQQNSRRLDVPPGDPSSVPDAHQLDHYVWSQAETMLPVRQKAQSIARELLH